MFFERFAVCTLSHALSFVNDSTGHCNRPTLYHVSTTSDTPLHAAPLQLSSIQQQATKQQTMPCNTPGNEPHQPYAILSVDRLSSLDWEGNEQMVTGHGIALPESCTLSKGFPAFKSTPGGVASSQPRTRCQTSCQCARMVCTAGGGASEAVHHAQQDLLLPLKHAILD